MNELFNEKVNKFNYKPYLVTDSFFFYPVMNALEELSSNSLEQYVLTFRVEER